MDLPLLRKQVAELALECGELAKSVRGNRPHSLKNDGSLVTEADRAVESLCRKRLPEMVPGSLVWGEEEGYSAPGPGGLWVVDPIDGTSNFAFGSPLWGVSIALIQGQDIVVGAVALPDFGDVYSAALGHGAFCNDATMAPIPPGQIRPEELVSYCDLTLTTFGSKALPGKMRYAGAFVIEGVWVLRQNFRGLISYKANVYDVAAIVCCAKELEADVRMADGSPFRVDEFVAARCIEKPFLVFPRESGFTLTGP